ncbi:MAG: HAMP domain-containing sensor histidine kinase [Trueperaceae bacterium]|nr:HAMP domain-containing sensor histidine kinase [Trueperaceae bacterium]
MRRTSTPEVAQGRADRADASHAVPDPTTALARWRTQALQGVLTTTALVAAVAYVPGTYAAASDGVWTIVVLNTLGWAAVGILASWRALPYRTRAVTFLALWFAFSAALTALAGPIGAGLAWMLALPVLAALLFGRPGAWAAVGGLAVLAVAYGVALQTGVTTRPPGVPGQPYTLPTWAAGAGSVTFLAVLLSSAILHVFGGLRRHAEELHDATHRLQASLEERQRLERELVAAGKARAVATLASGVAHDLNNLLVPMLAAGTAARDSADPGSTQRQRLNLVVTAAERARELSRRMVAFGRDNAERAPVAVDPLVQEVAALLRPSQPHGVHVHVVLNAEGACVHATEGELHQVLMNLATNAMRALPGDRGSVTIATHASDEAASIEVQDEGVGIPAEDLERVFEPYATGSHARAGTGLGLAIVRHVIDSLGGQVWLTSTPGVRTVATVQLPRVPPPSEARPRNGVGDATHGATPGGR